MEFEQVSRSTLVSRLAKTFIFQINISKYFSLRSLPASTLGKFLPFIRVSKPFKYDFPTEWRCCNWLHPYHHRPLSIGEG